MSLNFVFCFHCDVYVGTAGTSRLFPFQGSVSVAHPEGDFAVNVAGLTKLVGRRASLKRKNAIDHRREPARIDDLRDLSELLATRCAPMIAPWGRRVLWLSPPTALD